MTERRRSEVNPRLLGFRLDGYDVGRGISRELMEHLTDALAAFGAYDIGEEPQDPDRLWFTEPLLDRRLCLYVEDVS